MQYHAESFACENFNVNIVGFSGATPIASLLNNPMVSFTHLSQPPKKPNFMPGFVYYVFKAVFQWLQLFLTLLLFVNKPRHFLVQNPPAIPTLSVVWFIAWVKGCSFVIDWHNYAFTILALNLKKDHILVRFSKWYEGFFGYMADEHFCVTEAMKDDLQMKWNIRARVLYDRPPERFRTTSLTEKHELFKKLSQEYPIFTGSNDGTVFTKLSTDGTPVLQEQCPALVVSSTSWTEDEDFSILLEALKKYELCKKDDTTLPDLVCAITGKGPQKEYYQQVLNETEFSHVQVTTPWLEIEDYPRLIGSADVGICLHTSSSGLDLPMKVVDMFGCGLPVCAVHFSCLHELVQQDVNGLVFQSSEQLSEQLVELLRGFPNSCTKLKQFRENLLQFQENRWHSNWTKVVLPHVLDEE